MDGCNGATSTQRVACEATLPESSSGSVGGTPLTLLESPDSLPPTGDAMIDMMLLCERTVTDRRKLSDARRESAEQSQRSAEDQQVEKMREAARDTFAQAITSCAFSLAASGAQAASGCIQIEAGKLQYKAAHFEAADDKARTLGQGHFSALSSRATGYSKLWESFGSGASAIGGAVSGAMNKELKEDEADAKALEHSAARAGRAASGAADSAREMKEVADKTMQRLEQLIESRHQTRLALIQRA